MALNARSEQRLKGVDAALAGIIRDAAARFRLEVQVSEGVRTKQRQKELFLQGRSRTMNSYHLDGRAVDVVIIAPSGKACWDFALYAEFADSVLALAHERGVRVTWGGSWPTLRDGPHFQVEK